MADSRLALASVIAALRQELLTAQVAADGQSLPLRLGEVKIEASVVVTREAEGHAGIRFWIIEAGGAGSRTDADTQRVTITLHPATDFEVGRPTDGVPI